jgi:hypothetical protein
MKKTNAVGDQTFSIVLVFWVHRGFVIQYFLKSITKSPNLFPIVVAQDERILILFFVEVPVWLRGLCPGAIHAVTGGVFKIGAEDLVIIKAVVASVGADVQ